MEAPLIFFPLNRRSSSFFITQKHFLHNSWATVSTGKHPKAKTAPIPRINHLTKIKTELSRRHMEVTEKVIRMQISFDLKIHSAWLIFIVNGASWVQGRNSETAPPIQISRWNRSSYVITFTTLQIASRFASGSM